MNLSKLDNLTAPVINVTGNMASIVSSANQYTNDTLGFISLFLLTIILYLTLSDKTPFGDFGYSDIRALSISFGISCIIGLKQLETSFLNNFMPVAMMGVLFMATMILLLFIEKK
jgi:hypothetical protein